jgi:hemoglobin-like flavoprotein
MPNWKSLIPHRDNEEAPVPDEVWAPPARYSDEPSPKTTAELEHPEPAVGTVPIGNGATPAYDDEAPTEERTYDYSSDATGHVRDAADANVQGDDAEDGDPCPTCGHIVPPVRELLADTLSRVATRAPEVFATFYGSLFDERPDLAEMFPADLDDPGSDPSGGGHAQRERLLNASVAVASHYNPRNPESMAALNAALDKMGATHGESRMTVADPEWPGGRRPLLQREYDVVNKHLIATLRRFQGDSWTPMHTAAWWTALTYVADRMGATQILAAPRHAR